MNKTNKKILIVEDEKPIRDALCAELAGKNFEALEAKDGEEGLATALSEHPDLILLDIIMPVMDGMTMLKKLREDAWGKSVKVLMLTNLSDNEKIAEALEQGSYEYFVKSNWAIGALVEKIKQQLSGQD